MAETGRLRRYLAAAAGCAIAFCAFTSLRHAFMGDQDAPPLKACFIYNGDGSTPYTANFMKAQRRVEEIFQGAVTTEERYNVPEGSVGEALDSLSSSGCGIIFSNSYGYGNGMKEYARSHPGIEFCQSTCSNANEDPVLPNYHTFMGHIHEGRYASGVAAGMKLRELIKSGRVDASKARAGYVAAFPVPEVISGYTAFILGVRSVVPNATMVVRYTGMWSDYMKEKRTARLLIEEDGCAVISQHSDTTGPAVACEESEPPHEAYCVSYNESMADVAPTAYLTGTRINWEPYIAGAVKAVLCKKPIEQVVSGQIRGNDAGSGFKDGWVAMLEVNTYAAADGTTERLALLSKAFSEGSVSVFKAGATGADPEDPGDRIDLSGGYEECRDQSAPSFHYVLDGIVTVK